MPDIGFDWGYRMNETDEVLAFSSGRIQVTTGKPQIRSFQIKCLEKIERYVR